MRMYKMGDLHIGLDCGEFSLNEDNLIALFGADAEMKPDIMLRLEKMDPEQFQKAECLRRTGGFELLKLHDRLFLMNHWAQCRFGYGVWLDELKSGTAVMVYCNPTLKEQVELGITRFLSTVGLHSKFLQRTAPVLHASFIEHQGKGILFTGPSGTGKSTQADLWHQYADSEIINGDRVLLRESDGFWKAYGYPCCGSSFICLNRTLPVAAIVVLEQAAENQVCMMTAPQKVRALVAATEVYLWDQEEIEMAFRAAQEIVSKVPVIRLRCRPDADAVQVLRTFLEENHYA